MRSRALGWVIAAGVAACQTADLSVGSPPAPCPAVADKLAALELGNYAAPADRATVVAGKLAACTAAAVTVAEGECIATATDRGTAARCVPRMAPDGAPAAAAACADVIARLTSAIPAVAAGDGSLQLMSVLEISCVEDAWPDSLKRCILDAKADPSGGFQTCSQTMPKPLQEKVAARITAAMQQIQR